MIEDFPRSAAERTRWILARRGPRNAMTVDRPHAFLSEEEPNGTGGLERVSTIFLTNRECPWTCTMCDLWKETTADQVSAANVVEQIEFALARLPAASVLKLYNAGSFFDAGAIPRAAWKEIAAIGTAFERVVVECHPRLVANPVFDFAEMLSGRLEVALGLETAHPAALDALNKRFTIADYQRAARRLASNGVDLRTFLLVHPPFIPREESNRWLVQSLNAAWAAGSRVVSLIPLRTGNGAIDELVRAGVVQLPALSELEEAHEMGLGMRRGICLADTWDLNLFSNCAACLAARRERIERMNREQALRPRVSCNGCGHG